MTSRKRTVAVRRAARPGQAPPLVPTAAERAALVNAARDYLDALEQDQALGLRASERRHFVRLRAAARELGEALQPFLAGGANRDRARLQAHLRDRELLARAAPLALEGLLEPLYRLQWACDAAVGTGKGGAVHEGAYELVARSAEAWTRSGCGKVSSAERSRFCRLLLEAGNERGRDPRLPKLTRDLVRAALAAWTRHTRAGG
jgi:hypothetical protein